MSEERELLAVGGPLHGVRVTTTDPTTNRLVIQRNVEAVLELGVERALFGRFVIYELQRVEGVLVWLCEDTTSDRNKRAMEALVSAAHLKKW